MTSRSKMPLILACGGSFLAFVDVTITNLAVPDLGADFGVGVGSLSWVVTVYTVLFAALLAPAGRLADVIGRRRLFAAGVGVFTVASALAAAAPSLGLLLAARAVQGVGAALLMPASLAFVLADTAPEQRPLAIGLWSASASVAAALGPALGGVLVDLVGWRSLFCLNLPIGVWLLWRTLRLPSAPERAGRLPDLLGAGLVAGAVGSLVLAITEAPTWGWLDPATVVALAAAVVFTVTALMRAARHQRPAIEVDLWRNRTYAAANLCSFFFGAALYASLLIGVLFLVDVWGYSELDAGLAMTPGAIASAAVGITVGRSRRKPSARALVFGGALLIAGTSVALALWVPAEPHFFTAWLPGGLGLGLGMGAVSVGVSSAAALSVEPIRFAGATGLNIAARQVGGAVGIAILAAILEGSTVADGLQPFRNVYWMMAAACLLTALLALRLRPVAPPVADPGPVEVSRAQATPEPAR
jgi:EmrB/QacA subfamily drug resistance transporter